MAIYRGAGGTTDTTDQATVDEVTTLAAQAASSASSASSSASSASTSASTATTQATNAATSATNAASSATTASQSKDAAVTAKTAAETAQTAAESAQTAAESAKDTAVTYGNTAYSSSQAAIAAQVSAETARDVAKGYRDTAITKADEAASSATAAAIEATSASDSATSAAASATTASDAITDIAGYATAASGSADDAAASALSASNSATAAATSVASIGTSVTDAATSATNAQTSATNASDSETAAASSASAAATSATSSASSATAAASSATSAATSASQAAAAADAALSTLDSFDDRYLGTKDQDPTVDNDGNALASGALYFNVANNTMFVYDGSVWRAAYADGTNFVLRTGDTMYGNLNFGDNDKAIFGAGSDLQIYHTGSVSVIDENGTGNLYIKASDLRIQSSTGESYIECDQDSGVTLRYDNVPKLATTSTGIDVTGTITADGVTLGDNQKAVFGAGSDLQIYHNGDNSLIQDVGTGNLYITTNGAEIRLAPYGGNKNGLRVLQDGAVLAYYDNAVKLATTSTGIDVTGTATMDGLVSSAASEIFSNAFSGGETPALRLTNTSEGVGTTATLELIAGSTNSANNTRKAVIENVSTTGSGSSLQFYTTPDGTNLYRRLHLQNNGDISFYEDTGTTAKFFWDASEERLHVGDPSGMLSAFSVDTGASTIGERRAVLWARSRSGDSINQLNLQGDQWQFGGGGAIDTTPTMVVDYGSNSVGIGTSSPSTALDIIGANGAQFRIANTTADATLKNAYHSVRHYTNAEQDFIWALAQSNVNTNDLNLGGSTSVGNAATSIKFFTAANNTTTTGSEAMRIDSSGNLLVGKTTLDGNTAGVQVEPAGALAVTRSGSVTAYFNRKTSDGDIAVFRKDGTTVGSIGTYLGAAQTIYMGNGDTGIAFQSTANNAISPHNPSTNTPLDDAVSLGEDECRFKDLYLSGGVYLGGTGAANKLDDYESGTFTPTVGIAPSSGTISTLTGKYTKVGDLVTVYIAVTGSSLAIASYARFDGLPFNSTYNASGYYTTNSISSSAGGEAIQGGTSVYLGAGGGSSNQFILTITYKI